ncbi:uncharacterized protein LOC133178165 [Saccostrea echinata]|uniref:uncharacterized protein LOC133178165 n=1 Tax=Saccostrea echinata TaxID=191078 RepID=UPI002A82CD93|nr:uncharacterized protein LOC133178165 [Saccostrea echinata]
MDPRTSGQDVMRCDTCKTAVVQMHCLTCLVNLCKVCLGEHFSADLSRNHKIVDFKDRKSTPFHPGCTSHAEKQCQMYCNQCNIPVCTKCLASDQHLGHKLSEILQGLDERKDKLIRNQTELREAIYPTYQDIASDIQKRMTQLEKQYEDLSAAITNHGKLWHTEIDNLVEKLKADVDEMKKTQIQTVQKHLDEIHKSLFKIKEEINLIDVAVNSNDISKLYNVTINIDKYRQLPYKLLLYLPKFTPGRIYGKLLGTLSPAFSSQDKTRYSMKKTTKSWEARSSLPMKQLLVEPDTVTNIDTGYKCFLNYVACLSDEEIWTSGDDSIIKLFSIKEGSQLKSIRTKSGYMPRDITVTKSGDLVYIDYDYRTVNIAKNEKIEEVIKLQNWNAYGLCSSCSGDILVVMSSDDKKQSKVVRYSGSTEKQTFKVDNKGKPLYSSIKRISENKNLNICVSDSDAGEVVVINQIGEPRFRYTGNMSVAKKNPFKPQGITTDSQSHILTTDINNHCVHIIDQDGQFLRCIYGRLSQPLGLCTDAYDNLFVAQKGIRQVKKIKYQQ